MIANTIFAGALCALAVAAAGAGSRETLAVEEQAHDSEHFAAYCIGVFGADQTSLKSRFVPTCLTNEAADECSARIADIDQKRHHVDLALRGLGLFGEARDYCSRTLHEACQVLGRCVVLGRPIATHLVSAKATQRRPVGI
jgi:hypothetical protein